jgi:hypothetical protein
MPPQTSVVASPNFTTRTLSPYLSPKKAMAPDFLSFHQGHLGGLFRPTDVGQARFGSRPLRSGAIRRRWGFPCGCNQNEVSLASQWTRLGSRGSPEPAEAPRAKDGSRCGDV